MDFAFDFTYDGTDITVDAGSAVPAGTSLSPGDSFVATLRTAPGSYFEVTDDFTQSFPMSFIVNSGTRVGDATASFLHNGTENLNISELGITQQEVHIGAQNWSLTSGLTFDTVELSYDLLSAIEFQGTDPVGTLIADRPYIFGSISNDQRPFFRHDNVAYVVPEPACIALLSLAGTALLRRRRA